MFNLRLPSSVRRFFFFLFRSTFKVRRSMFDVRIPLSFDVRRSMFKVPLPVSFQISAF